MKITGISRHDWFAGMALGGLIASWQLPGSNGRDHRTKEDIQAQAKEFADRMTKKNNNNNNNKTGK